MASFDPDTAFRSQLIAVNSGIRNFIRQIDERGCTRTARINGIQQLRAAEKAAEGDISKAATTPPNSFLVILRRDFI
ncbi:unnamed protein product [Anisakis simplex]|uniref:Uncharacterized protein n=1 Tax=Anisakis simplex TaxID=6269 RepID=A0A3P6NXD7_ANISI|nr:unnamed protein product [Anisakis simplex]